MTRPTLLAVGVGGGGVTECLISPHVLGLNFFYIIISIFICVLRSFLLDLSGPQFPLQMTPMLDKRIEMFVISVS